jgi:DNA modification methylase
MAKGISAFPGEWMDSVLQGDCLEILPGFPSESVDLIFADPPYNLQLNGELWRPNQTKVEAVNDEWDRFSSFEEYDDFSEKWLTQARRVLKPDGVIWTIGTYHNIFRVGRLMQDLGFWILNDVVWIKTNPMPNFRGTRFTNAHETLILGTKSSRSKNTFHYKSMKAFNDGLQMRSDWEIPICGRNERAITGGRKAHSTQKPKELLRRILLSTSNPGDIVLDPFAGTGTALVAAKELGRRFIGIEKNASYVDIAVRRIASAVQIQPHLLDYPMERKEPRIPFGTLVSNGWVGSGEKLYSKDRQHTAVIMANGTIASGNLNGSIHSVSAALLGKPASNGWAFWYVERGGKLVSIDELRQKWRRAIFH